VRGSGGGNPPAASRVAELEEGAAELGIPIPTEMVEQLEAREENFTVDAANWPVWEAWENAATQWRTSASGTYTGLDYAGVSAALTLSYPGHAPKRLAKLFKGIQLIEAGILQGLTDKSKEGTD